MKLRIIVLALSAAALAACAFPVNESYFFLPQPVAHKAQEAGEMRLDRQEQITGPFADEHYLDGRVPLLAGRLPGKVTHEFVSLGGERIAVTRVKAANVAADEPLIVYCGGNASDRIHQGVYFSDKVLPWGEVLMFDYPGYGDSSGVAKAPAMFAVQKDLSAWIDVAAPGRPLLLWGHSLGGLVCAEVAANSKEADAIILETTAPSTAALADTRKPGVVSFVPLKLENGLADYDIPDALANFKGPVLVIGAEKDQVIPVQQARNLSAELKAKGLNVEYREYAGLNHNNAALNSGFAKDAKMFFAGVADRN